MVSQGSCGSASIRCRVMPESDRKDAFVPGQSLVVLGCSWRAGTMRFPLSAFPCAFAPHPPNPLLPQGEKGESGVLMAGNGRWHAGASKKPAPVRRGGCSISDETLKDAPGYVHPSRCFPLTPRCCRSRSSPAGRRHMSRSASAGRPPQVWGRSGRWRSASLRE